MNKIIDYKHIEDAIISTIRAISKIDDVDVNFEDEISNFEKLNQNSFADKVVNLPLISNNSDIGKTRAIADLGALYLKFHQEKIHQVLGDENSQKLYDDFEKFRIIDLGFEEYKGIKANLENVLEESLNKINDYSFLPFLILPFDEKKKDTLLQKRIEAYKKIIGKDLLAKITELSKSIHDQRIFSSKSLELIDFLNSQKDGEQKGEKNSDKTEQSENNKAEEKQENEEQIISNEENVEKQVELDHSGDKEELDDEKKDAKIMEKIEEEKSGEQEIDDLQSNKSNLKFINKYTIFTKKFDQIIKAEDLMDRVQAEDLRSQLELKIEKLEKISKKLTAKLKRKLLAKKQILFEFDKEEGLLDQKKISQIIARPLARNHYLTVQENDYQNTVLSILIDNSGSMRGAPIVMSAMAAEIITKIFEKFGIKIEILGFTTVDWRGGKSRKLWEEMNKPKNPGRLSDIRHIIYKNANQTFKKSKNNLALMLKDGILKENIDGEALIWAATRLKNRSEKRKILLVISDGTPVDDSTNSFNDSNILEDHLHQTIHHLEKHSRIEVAAIGIGHEVGEFYHNSISIKNIEELGDVMINKICDLL